MSASLRNASMKLGAPVMRRVQMGTPNTMVVRTMAGDTFTPPYNKGFIGLITFGSLFVGIGTVCVCAKFQNKKTGLKGGLF